MCGRAVLYYGEGGFQKNRRGRAETTAILSKSGAEQTIPPFRFPPLHKGDAGEVSRLCTKEP